MKEMDFEKLEFVESFVVFLDVLGFSELVYNDSEKELQKINFYFWMVEKYLKKLQEELEKINTEIIKLDPKETDLLKLDYILISDSIIITIKQCVYDFKDMNKDKFDNLDRYFNDTNKYKKIKPLKEKQKEMYLLIKEMIGLYHIHNKNAFEKLCEAIVQIQKILASLDIWLRGAISAGITHISTNKKQIVGKAYIDAYKMEEKAKYPRVILDKKKIFKALNFKDENEFLQAMPYIFNWGDVPFKKSIPLFLDYIYYTTIVASNENRNTLDKVIENVLKNYENSKLENYHDKFVWLLEYIETCLVRGNDCYSDLLTKLKQVK